jgi:hypothetical protein
VAREKKAETTALVHPRVEEVDTTLSEDYFVDERADAMGTQLLCETRPITYGRLVEVIGPPTYEVNEKHGDGKVSTEWHFRNHLGHVFTIYDYKETTLYCEDRPTPSQFRSNPDGYRWHIGGADRAQGELFLAWLMSKVGDSRP